jgi:transposase-like protein
MLKTIFAQETKADAEARWSIVADALREKQRRLGALMDGSRDDVLAYMSLPREHWAQIASTTPLERVNREVKRRSDVIGIFPNDEAIVPGWRADARDQRRMGGRKAIHVA